MYVTALPSDTPRPIPTLRQRAAAVLAGWRQWRAARGLTVDHLIDAGLFTSLLIAWGCGYCLLCPAPVAHHSAAQHVADARR